MKKQTLWMGLRNSVSTLAFGLLIAGGVAVLATALMPDPAIAGQGKMYGQSGVSVTHDDGDDESEGRGPHYGKPTGERGGKPAWAAEGIPEVELGRLNVARAPDRVLEQALNEALSELTPAMATLYNMSIDEAADYMANNWDDVVMFDSPVMNLGLLQDALDGTSSLNGLVGIDNDVMTLAAIFLGVASDKTTEISRDTVVAVTTILGFPDLPASLITQIANDAEDIREAVAEGHG